MVTTQDRLMALYRWARSGLSAPDFAAMPRMKPHALRTWRRNFPQYGPTAALGLRASG